jgi:hypothetical protein
MTLWTMDQVAALTAWQRCDWAHPFTCAMRDDHPVIDGDKGILVATVNGWICQCCDYTQTWAHDFMFKGAPPLSRPGREGEGDAPRH